MADNTAADSQTPTPVEKQADFGEGPRGEVSRWLTEIQQYETTFHNWQVRASKVVKRYRDERPDGDTAKKFNILWSNIETLKPAIYARPPAPDVQRRYKTADHIGRAAATILERALTYTIDQYNLDGVLQLCLIDYLLAGRGQGWVRYEAETEERPGLDGKMVPTVTHEKACIEYLFWQDFGHTPARVWTEVRACWRKAYLTRAKLVEKFGDEIGKKVPLDTEPATLSEEQKKAHSHTFKTACVYEIWDKEGKQVIWIAKGYGDAPLKKGPPPIKFDGFFPCPEPLYGSLTTDTTVPLPDYAQYQDQAEEIDNLTARINLLTGAIKVAGLYDASMKDKLGQIIDLTQMVASADCANVLIPVDSWAAFAEKGGIKGTIDFMPLDQIVNAAVTLYEAREKAKQELYEISGMADVMRGATDPDETAAAQKIKGRFGAMRLETRQQKMANFAKGLIRLASEVIAEQFSPMTLEAMTGVKLPMQAPQPDPMAAMTQPQLPAPQVPPGMSAPQQAMGSLPPVGEGAGEAAAVPAPAPAQPQPTWPEVIALLRNDLVRGFRIDIETDSTIALDEQAEKEGAIELLNASTPFLEKMAMAAANGMHAVLPVMGETFMQVIRRHKIGRNVEQNFEEMIEGLKAMAKAPRPDPAQQELELEKQKAEQAAETKKHEVTQNIALKQAETAAGIQAANAKTANDIKLKKMEFAFEQQREDRKLKHEIEMANTHAAIDKQKMENDHQHKTDQYALDYDFKMLQREDEAEQEHMADPSKPRRVGPLQNIKGAVEQHAQVSGQLQQAIAQQTETLAQIAEAQAQTQQVMLQMITSLREALMLLAQPKEAKPIRGKDGRIVNVIVGPAGTA